MGALGNVRRLDLKYAFKVLIPGLTSIDFATCSEISGEIGEATYWQGGSIIAIKEPGRLTHPDVTLERGSSRDQELYQWFNQIANGAANRGMLNTPAFKRPVHIWQNGRDGSPVEQVNLYAAFLKTYSIGDWNNDADEFRVEKIVIAYQYFERIQLSPF
jgi:phage tail-like protein